MIYISYATKNTPYTKVLETHLLPDLKRWKLNYDIKYIEDKGSWSANTHYKATFIKEMLLKHKKPVIFLDADATIERYPELFNQLEDYDIAFHYLDWYLQWRGVPGKKREVLSGTLYLNYNDKILKFLDEWIDENNHNRSWEQKNMQWVLRRWKSKLKIYNLPPEYCCVLLHNYKIPKYINNPVIIHHQASRKYKRWK